jgi:hypothetical protein
MTAQGIKISKNIKIDFSSTTQPCLHASIWVAHLLSSRTFTFVQAYRQILAPTPPVGLERTIV